MVFIKKHILEITLSVAIIVLYFSLRLIHLSSLPIFTDEAIYLRWAQIALRDSNWRFISLTDGKQPMFMWATMIMMKFIHDPIIAGRLVSVGSGFFTMIGLWFLTFELFKNKQISFLTTVLYVAFPFTQVYDRMALYDGMSGTFTVWALYFAVLLVRKIRLDLAYTLGIVIGAGALNKSENFFSAYLLPFTLLLFDFKRKDRVKQFFLWCLFALFAVIISEVMYSILRLSPFYHIINEKTATFVYPVSDWFHMNLNDRINNFTGNLGGLTHWLLQYLNLSYVILIICAFFSFKMIKEKLLMFIYFLLPFLALAVFGRILYPRFIYFMALTLLPLASCGLVWIIEIVEKKFLPSKRSKYFSSIIVILITVIFTFYPFYVSYKFAIDPVNAPIAQSDIDQYISGWTAGWGVKESIAYLGAQAKNQKIYIATEGTFGLMPFALELYLVDNPHVTLKSYWPLNDTLPTEVLQAAQKMPTYFVFYQPQHQVIPPSYPLRLIQKTQEGNSQYYYRLYQVMPQ